MNETKGFVKGWRDIFHEMSKLHDGKVFLTWSYLLNIAQYKDNMVSFTGRDYELEAGQAILSRQSVATFFDIPISNIRNYFNILVQRKFISSKPIHKGVLITILDWEEMKG